jgi:hypothetical protein
MIAGAVGVTVVGLAAVISGVGPLRAADVARPACSDLPSRTAVSTALANHLDLTGQIEAVGAGVHVTSTSPCTDQPERALVTITYSTSAERTGVNHILTTADGFGVPVELANG